MGGPPECQCGPQLDLLNKFHHLDQDVIFGEHSKEEVHHCTQSAEQDEWGWIKEYEIQHCGCKVSINCEVCNRPYCPARAKHAINMQRPAVALHLEFALAGDKRSLHDYLAGKRVDEHMGEILGAALFIKLTQRCPKNPGWWHIDVDHALVEFPLLEQILKDRKDLYEAQQKINRLENEQEEHKKLKAKLRKDFGL